LRPSGKDTFHVVESSVRATLVGASSMSGLRHSKRWVQAPLRDRSRIPEKLAPHCRSLVPPPRPTRPRSAWPRREGPSSRRRCRRPSSRPRHRRPPSSRPPCRSRPRHPPSRPLHRRPPSSRPPCRSSRPAHPPSRPLHRRPPSSRPPCRSSRPAHPPSRPCRSSRPAHPPSLLKFLHTSSCFYHSVFVLRLCVCVCLCASVAFGSRDPSFPFHRRGYWPCYRRGYWPRCGSWCCSPRRWLAATACSCHGRQRLTRRPTQRRR